MGTLVWQWPQIAMTVYFFATMVVAAAMDGHERAADKYRFSVPFLRWMLLLSILYFGGFWTELRP